jgi:hypothetical protein
VMVTGAIAAEADGPDKDAVHGGAETVPEAVRVTVIKMGGTHLVQSVTGGGTGEGERAGCTWSVLMTPGLDDAPYWTAPSEPPHPEAVFALLLCDGVIVQPIWIAPDDVVDLDGLARDEAQRYVEDVLVPAVEIGVNPTARGLVGLASWFWVEGFTGTATAPSITAFGLTIDVRMSSGTVTWDFGDGTELVGDLGRAYPEPSTVQHAHQRHGTYTVAAAIDLVPEYRVDGGPWRTLPPLQVTARADHPVEQRQAVITDA